MESCWWYALNGERNGPITTEGMKALFLQGTLSRSTLVWREGLPEWRSLEEVDELKSIAMALPPELPSNGPTASAPAPTLEAPTRNYATQPSVRGLSWPVAGPWRRFFARTIDLWLIVIPVSFLVGVALALHGGAFGQLLQQPGNEYLFGWFCYPLFMLVESLVYAPRRITPGKALLGLEVLNDQGNRATPSQYFKRQWGVWWYGLATAAPLISLFSMRRQYSYLKSGERTTYDKGRFVVRAKPIGFFRYLAATLCILGVFVLLGALSELGKESRPTEGAASTSPASEPPSTQWTNPTTGKSVALPLGWTADASKNSQQQEFFVFARHGITIVLAGESVARPLSLEEYGLAWQNAVSDSMTFGAPTDFTLHGTRALAYTGYVVNDQSQHVRATLFRGGALFWRTVIVGGDSETQADDVVKVWQDVSATAI